MFWLINQITESHLPETAFPASRSSVTNQKRIRETAVKQKNGCCCCRCSSIMLSATHKKTATPKGAAVVDVTIWLSSVCLRQGWLLHLRQSHVHLIHAATKSPCAFHRTCRMLCCCEHHFHVCPHFRVRRRRHDLFHRLLVQACASRMVPSVVHRHACRDCIKDRKTVS